MSFNPKKRMWNNSRFFIWCLLILSLHSCTRKTDYENKVDKFRSQTIGFYTRPEESPLDSLELVSFKGIKYFPINPLMKTEATIEWFQTPEWVEMKHSRGDVRNYMKAAILHFHIVNKIYSLIAYQTVEEKQLHTFFVPFRDKTNTVETYGGGRYLDVHYTPEATSCELDFNFAYVPYCAYTHRYSCPVVPKDNMMDVEINAGEKGM